MENQDTQVLESPRATKGTKKTDYKFRSDFYINTVGEQCMSFEGVFNPALLCSMSDKSVDMIINILDFTLNSASTKYTCQILLPEDQREHAAEGGVVEAFLEGISQSVQDRTENIFCWRESTRTKKDNRVFDNFVFTFYSKPVDFKPVIKPKTHRFNFNNRLVVDECMTPIFQIIQEDLIGHEAKRSQPQLQVAQ